MGGGYVSNAGVFLIDVLFGLYIIAVMLRFLFQLVRADFYNPISQAIVAVTNVPLRAMRRWIPAVRHIDTASIVLMLVVQMINTGLVLFIVRGGGGIGGVFVIAVAELLQKGLYIFMFAILILVIVSWVAPNSYSPALDLLDSLTRPLLRPIRRVVPLLGGLDLSPLVAVIVLQLGAILLIAPIQDLGGRLL
jgi:YggT family protein